MMQKSFQNPLISVITVCYNSADTISTTINSMLLQTYSNFEYIIVDGKSTDNTLSLLEAYKTKFGNKIKIISEKDNGIYNAMNKGIKLSTGEIVGILNSDDYYSPETLEKVAEKYYSKKNDKLVIIGNMVRVDENDKEIYSYKFTQKLIDKKQCFGHPSMFATREAYKEVGEYDESFALAADGDWQYRAMDSKDIEVVLCDTVFNHMRSGGASDNFKYRWKWFSERKRMKIKNGRGNIFSILIYELKSVLRTDIKNIVPKEWMSKLYKIRYRNGVNR